MRTTLVASLVFASLVPAVAAHAAAQAAGAAPVPGDEEEAPVQLTGPRKPPAGQPAATAPPAAKLDLSRKPKMMWVGWSFGAGYGWHARGPLETQPRLEVDPGVGPGGLGHFGPEFGYQLSENLALSAQLRLQVVPKTETDPTMPGDPHQWANSILLRAAYTLPGQYFQPYFGGAVGGGQGFRFRVDPQPSHGLPTSDTVRGGPFVFGPLAGLVFPFDRRISAVAEVRVLLGVGDFAGIGDFNLGLQFDL